MGTKISGCCREARSTFQMVEMYLYPEIEVLWAQAEQGYGPGQQPPQANTEAVAAAQKLLNDLHVTSENALQHKVSWASKTTLSFETKSLLGACAGSVLPTQPFAVGCGLM